MFEKHVKFPDSIGPAWRAKTETQFIQETRAQQSNVEWVIDYVCKVFYFYIRNMSIISMEKWRVVANV